MSDEIKNVDEKNNVSRRRALKVIAVGVGAAGALPVLNNTAQGQQAHGEGSHHHPQGTQRKAAGQPKFFSAQEMATISAMSEIIIPTDDHSPGAIAAEVPQFIDLMVSESPAEAKSQWRSGLDAIEKMSQRMFSKGFTAASPQQQVQLMTQISKNERDPKTPEERFFRTIKNLTIDGYYTSEVGIHKELQYKGNAYLKEFPGCTHPEHKA